MKKFAILFLFLVLGFILSILLDSFLRAQVFNLYRWSTDNKLIFIGKNLHFFASPIFYISFSISFSLLGFANRFKKVRSVFLNSLLWIFIFSIAMISTSAFDANAKIATCTACDNGILRIHFNTINYGLILGIASVLSAIPSCIHLLKKKKQ